MLNRCENDVMRAVYCLCDGTDGCLISPLDIMSLLPKKAYAYITLCAFYRRTP